MARFAREICSHSHRLALCALAVSGSGADDERESYLSRVDAALLDSDWQSLAYALMPDRIDWLAVAGETPLSRFIKPWHVGFALWLNRNQKACRAGVRRRAVRPSSSRPTPSTSSPISTTRRSARTRRRGERVALDQPPGLPRSRPDARLAARRTRHEAVRDVAGRRPAAAAVHRVRREPARRADHYRAAEAVRTALIERAIDGAGAAGDGSIAEVLDGVNSVSGIEPARIRSRIVRARWSAHAGSPSWPAPATSGARLPRWPRWSASRPSSASPGSRAPTRTS